MAITDYRALASYGDYTLVEARPKTGRTHQIRVHFAYIGHPLAGDVVYGRRRQRLDCPRQFLHASRLGFFLPSAGTWVELHDVVLRAGEWAPQVPNETQRVPLERRVRGWLVAPAALGDHAEVTTAAGRRLGGQLVEVEPAYSHSFGPPVPELLDVGPELRALLREGPA